MGSRLVTVAARERYGSDERVDERETVGNSLGRAPLAENGWKRRLGGRRGNRGKQLGESSVGKERDGNDDWVDGGETVGNSFGRAPLERSDLETTIGWTEGNPQLGRAPFGRSDTEATRGRTERKPWEIAWGELRGEGARWKRREGGRRGNRGI